MVQIEILEIDAPNGDVLYLTVGSMGPTQIELSDTLKDAQAFRDLMIEAYNAACLEMATAQQPNGLPA